MPESRTGWARARVITAILAVTFVVDFVTFWCIGSLLVGRGPAVPGPDDRWLIHNWHVGDAVHTWYRWHSRLLVVHGLATGVQGVVASRSSASPEPWPGQPWRRLLEIAAQLAACLALACFGTQIAAGMATSLKPGDWFPGAREFVAVVAVVAGLVAGRFPPAGRDPALATCSECGARQPSAGGMGWLALRRGRCPACGYHTWLELPGDPTGSPKGFILTLWGASATFASALLWWSHPRAPALRAQGLDALAVAAGTLALGVALVARARWRKR